MKKSFIKFVHLTKVIGLSLIILITVYSQNSDTNLKSNQILLNVTVTTKKGDWVTGLKAENFKVYDGKTLQPVTFFSAGDVPVSIGILIDKSGSTAKGLLSELEQALSKFINKGHSSNEYFLMSFTATQELLQDNTQDRKKVLQAIEKLQTIKPIGNTKFYDAVQASIEKVSKGKNGKKVLLIISDGMDNESKNDYGNIRNLIKQSDVLLYGINPFTSEIAVTNEIYTALAALDELTKLSGGKMYHPQALRELNEFFYRIAEEIQNQYTIGFMPSKDTDKNKKESWRKVKVEINAPDVSKIGKHYVRTRDGYPLNAKSK
jgi:VWFA-related protein